MLSNKKIFLVSKPSLWSNQLYDRLIDFDCSYFNDDSYIDFLSQKPDWIFFFHWSKIVPKEIFDNNKCVVLHTGNLPKGRGGSPIQNQILDGILESKVNAIVMGAELDAGDVYCSLPITLQGSLTDIWLSFVDRSYELIKKCIIENPEPIKQIGEPQIYKRNKNNRLPLTESDDLIEIHKFIQMLDGEGYPNAFLEVGDFRLEFFRSKMNDGNILSDVIIRRINE
jgi:methionyl-tRNA formyltransferase